MHILDIRHSETRNAVHPLLGHGFCAPVVLILLPVRYFVVAFRDISGVRRNRTAIHIGSSVLPVQAHVTIVAERFVACCSCSQSTC